MTAITDVAVIGLGAIGSATLHRLALQGVKAIGIDRFTPPHDRGSTHGETRITRLSIAEGPAYVPLARRSHEIWRELEAQSGEMLFNQLGLLVIGEGDGAPSHGQAGFLGSTIASAVAHDIAHEVLDSAEIRRRYPQFQVGDQERAFFEPSAGVLSPERCVSLQLRLARELGAEVRTGEKVVSMTRSGTAVSILTDKGRIEANRVVLAAGAWSPGLAGDVMPRVTAVQRQTLLWFDPDEPALYDPARCPPFIWMHGTREEDYLYGFPMLPGATGVKAASERYAGHVDPDQVDRDVTTAEADGIYHRHIAGRLRGIGNKLLKSATCLYTVTPDADFIIDWVDADERVLVASCCSGHGFKHSPALGEQLAQLATGSTRAAAPSFGLARFG